MVKSSLQFILVLWSGVQVGFSIKRLKSDDYHLFGIHLALAIQAITAMIRLIVE